MKPAVSAQKLRGGYYTPEPVAGFLARWAIRSATDRVLEPSCGDGSLLTAAAQRLLECGATPAALPHLLYAVEIDPTEARKAAQQVQDATQVPEDLPIQVGDFFAHCTTLLAAGAAFDTVIGNPPFIRYQDFAEEQRLLAFGIMQQAGLHPTRLTNSWVPFLVAATMLLNSGGRIAMVIPAELLQVNYAAELRLFLSRQYSYLTLITFRTLIFAGIQQEVVLLLGEKRPGEHSGIRTIELNGLHDLVDYRAAAFTASDLKAMDHSKEKWTMYFLDKAELELLRRLRTDLRITTAKPAIDVDVGIVTGLNQFFVLTAQQVKDTGLAAYTLPLVGRSTHLQGIVFSADDWQRSVEKAAGAFLLNLPAVPFDQLPAAAQVYVKQGEAQGMHQGYKCRIRDPWYHLPSIWQPAAFMLRQVHSYPKLILNQAGATCTDTIHRVRLCNGVAAATVTAAFLNSLTFAFAEVMGRSYGGGVLELEPNEAEQLPIPLTGADQLDPAELDRLLRLGDIYTVLDITDTILLRQGLGLSAGDGQRLRAIWQKLRDRRVNRKAAAKRPIQAAYSQDPLLARQLRLIAERQREYDRSA